jgi:putative ATP-binding cassette transporter
MRRLGLSLRDAWRLAGPYWRGEERGRALLLLVAVVGLNLSLVGLEVMFSYWSREFFNSIEGRDEAAFFALLLWGRQTESGPMPGWVFLTAAYIAVAVYALYLQQALQMRWRRWLTREYLDSWLADRAYYRIALADAGTDNPDQRIADDLRLFVDETLDLGLGLMRSVVTLLSFILVLWGLSGPLEVFGVVVPGYMVWVALFYAAAGTGLAHLIGRRLIGLNFDRQRAEADFRYALVRLRDNVEGIALHGGEADEKRGLLGRFGVLVGNWWEIMVATKRLTLFTSTYGRAADVFPYLVAAPRYFSGAIPLGGLTQTATAFAEVQGALSWFVSRYTSIAQWRATVQRLIGFRAAVDAARAAAAGQGAGGPRAEPGPGPELALEDLSLFLPDGRALLEDASARIAPGEAVLVTGASGSGKSTLFRAVAGIWPFGRGRVRLPAGARALFLPQRPYLPLGTLRRALCYPVDPAEVPDEAARAALRDAGLGHLEPRLDEEDAWDRRLSGGEQQRVALARALLLKPDWLFLDEATASLDPDAEAAFYTLLRERLPGATMVSIAHRPAVARFHGRTLRLRDRKLVEAQA